MKLNNLIDLFPYIYFQRGCCCLANLQNKKVGLFKVRVPMAIQWAKRKVGTNAQKRQRVANPTTPGDALKQKLDSELPKQSIGRNNVELSEDSTDPAPKDSVQEKQPSQIDNDSKRQTLIIDYQKDICTQYFKTGRCRYGDACKFSHERGSKPSKRKDPEPSVTPVTKNQCLSCSSEEDLVLATTCNHPYCENCFLKLSKQSKHCIACSKSLKSAKPL